MSDWRRGQREKVRERLVHWFHRHRRSLPWREDRTPYRTWISEIMLQQTQVEAVRPFFERFMARFPTIQALAEATEDDVLHTWAGLGYYSRARNLHRTARLLVQDYEGNLPATAEQLVKLPGIGRYTAGAVASLAYDQPCPILDGNVMRVLARVLAMRGDPRCGNTNARLWKAAAELVDGPEPGVLNESLMELGATICIPASPRCTECPIQDWCQAKDAGIQTELPERNPPPALEDRTYAAVIARTTTKVVMERRSDATIWKGLWVFPTDFPAQPADGAASVANSLMEKLGLPEATVQPFGLVRHGVMNWRIQLHVFEAVVDQEFPVPPGRFEWTPFETLLDRAMPSPHRRIARMLQKDPSVVSLY